MRDVSLPSPGSLSQSHNLRRVAAAAISGVEITAKFYPGGKSEAAKTLSAFFTACAASLSALWDAVAPTVVSHIRTATNTAVVTFSEPVTPGAVATSAFVFSPVRTVVSATVVGSTVVVVATGVIATDTITYTKPASGFVIKDGTGNEVASFTGVLA